MIKGLITVFCILTAIPVTAGQKLKGVRRSFDRETEETTYFTHVTYLMGDSIGLCLSFVEYYDEVELYARFSYISSHAIIYGRITMIMDGIEYDIPIEPIFKIIKMKNNKNWEYIDLCLDVEPEAAHVIALMADSGTDDVTVRFHTAEGYYDKKLNRRQIKKNRQLLWAYRALVAAKQE